MNCALSWYFEKSINCCRNWNCARSYSTDGNQRTTIRNVNNSESTPAL